ncbi:MAG: glycosyltransferase family 2 protein [Verrucomicrobiota bacterium]
MQKPFAKRMHLTDSFLHSAFFLLPSDCAAVIPCFNEAANIGTVVAGVKKFLPAVIVVDDGSSDDTAQQARAAGAKVIHSGKNSGKGAALRLGWRHAVELGFDWVLMLDGDGQHATEDIPKILAAGSMAATLVVGNRMDHADAMPPVRRFVNRWMSRRLSHLTGKHLPDSQCGFRLAHLDTLLRLALTANRFEIESEMLVAFLAAGEEIAFVPVQTVYLTGGSKIRPLADTWRWWRWWLAQRRKIPLGAVAAPNHAPAIENGTAAIA